ncbi:2-isopropylmalate synthase [Candidatus Micrarchaeota archaeon]|nr:2-isopropylmalate synthase [Candidatus Micrarchaeota archaeon]
MDKLRKVRPDFRKKVVILDTTLRDGEQTPGVMFSPDEKVTIALALRRFGVDIIEAGSAINGDSEKQGIRKVCDALESNHNVTSFARIKNVDIDAVVDAGAGRISLVFPSSDLHISKKLKTDREGGLKIIMKSMEYAKSRGLVVEMLAEDGSRADPEFLKKIAKASQEGGAEAFCVCDTLGILDPFETHGLFEYLREGLGIGLTFHGHNDRRMAVANTLAALQAGADGFHGTINGLGERCGNCSLETVALELKLKHGIETADLTRVMEISKLVAGLSNVRPADSAPVVGTFAFLHDAGIHHDGLKKGFEMYEPYSPETVGRKHQLSLGKLSGRRSIEMKLEELGVEVPDEKIPDLVEAVKRMGEARQIVSDADFCMLVEKVKGNGVHDKVKVEEVSVTTGNRGTPVATVHLRFNGNKETKFGAAPGDGPVDAALRAVSNALGDKINPELVSYEVAAIAGGSDSMIRLNVTVKLGGKEVNASAMGTDIILASVDAYVKAINVLL